MTRANGGGPDIASLCMLAIQKQVLHGSRRQTGWFHCKKLRYHTHLILINHQKKWGLGSFDRPSARFDRRWWRLTESQMHDSVTRSPFLLRLGAVANTNMTLELHLANVSLEPNIPCCHHGTTTPLPLS